jgi:hypothetical protein
MIELFQTTKQNISLQLKNIFYENELEADRVIKEYLTTAADRKTSKWQRIKKRKYYAANTINKRRPYITNPGTATLAEHGIYLPYA